MKTKLFDRAVYAEGLRQLKVVGTIYLLAVEFCAIFNCGYYALYDYDSKMTGLRTVDFMHANMLLLPLVIFFAAVMTFMLFQFQNKRHESDFYHSLSTTRASLYSTFMAAVLSWLIVGILLSALTTVVGFSCFSPHYLLDMSSVPVMLLCLFGSAFYISGVLVFAMNVTGTVFSNMMVSTLIFIIPPILETIFKASLENILPILASDYLPSLFTNDPIGFLFAHFFNYETNTNYAQIGLYSLIVGLLFMTAALFLFRRRGSEIAGHPALNRPLQAVFRIAFAMLICLIPCNYIVKYFGTGSLFTVKKIFNISVMYIAALAGYFLYELLTTRKLKNLPRAIPSLAILAALNLAFVFGNYGVREEVLNTAPAAAEIENLTFITCNYSFNSNLQLDETLLNTPVQNCAVAKIVSDRLSNEIATIRNMELNYSDNLLGVTTYSFTNTYTAYIVKIKFSGRTIYRQLQLTSSDITSINKLKSVLK